MENEQEGIELETINPNKDDSIILSNIVEDEEDTEAEESTEVETEVETENDNEKEESLKRGVNKERQLRKAAEKKNKELEARIVALESANKTPTKSTVDELIEQGVDENIAKSIAKAIDSKSNNDSATKQELADVRFKLELTEKSKEEGFEDIAEYSEEIKELVDKGLNLEQAYYATTYKKPSNNTKSEIERKVEAKIKNNNARKEILGNINSNNGASTSSKTKINATAAEKAMAAAAGISIEEYVAIRDMKSVKDYNSYNSKKK